MFNVTRGRSLPGVCYNGPILLSTHFWLITGPPNGQVLLCWLASVIVICRRCMSSSVIRPTGAWTVSAPAARGRSGGRHCTVGQYGYVPLGRHLVEQVMNTVLMPAFYKRGR